MVDYNKAGQSLEGNVSSPIPPVVSGGRKKMWIIVGVSVLVIVLLVFGGFFVISSLDKEDTSSGGGRAGAQTQFPGTTDDDTISPTDDTAPTDDTTPTDNDTTPTDSGDVVSLQDLLDEENNQTGDDGPGTELGMTITSLTCSDTSFDIEVTVGALPIEGVIFYFKDGTLNLPYSELKFIPPAGVEAFSFDVTGQGLDVSNSIVDVKAFTLEGESGILDSQSC